MEPLPLPPSGRGRARRHRRWPVLAGLLPIGALLTAAPAHSADPLPLSLAPTRVAGAGLNVIDLDAERDWYTIHLGMKVVMVVGPKDRPVEYVMAMTAAPDQPMLCLLHAPRPTGPNRFGRVIFQAPDARALAARLAAQGVPMREVAPGVSYSITDPEGNDIELYQPPAPSR